VQLEDEFKDPQATFEEVKDLILKNYYTDIDETTLYHAAIEGMLRHISPPENPELGKLWTEAAYAPVKNALKGVKVSLGIKSTYSASEGSLLVTGTTEGAPAHGVILPGDRIKRIDGKPLKNLPVSEINALMNGPVDSAVTLTVVRDITVEEIKLTRTEFATTNLNLSLINAETLLVEIYRFTSDISKQIKGELVQYKDLGVKYVIIDLRSNPGGVFVEALRTAEIFLGERSVLLRTQKRDKNQNYVSSSKEPLEFKIAILTNESTASSAEILTGALQDHRKAVVIGTKTYGKGVFEQTFTLKNDYRAKFIIGAMYTPRNKPWQSKGIVPDFSVKQDAKKLEALRKLKPADRLVKDTGLLTAYKILRR
jgi:carboxyl-terminal processing protease